MTDRRSIPSPLYLASNSPRRKELMTLSGWTYNVLPAQVDETPLPDEYGVRYVQRLAKSKADHAASHLETDGVVIAADTTVVDCQVDGRTTILGKPQDHGEAKDMLLSLRGHAHQVHTAITILSTPDGRLITDLCTTQVPMRHYSDQEIEAYIASGDPMDKAGAYAIQHSGFHPVDNLEGCYANVMGLPLCHLKRSLYKLSIFPPADVPQACQAALAYHCSVYPLILKESIQDYT
ncbi:MAG TPA: Maf family protein [Anaerolineales bacterium]